MPNVIRSKTNPGGLLAITPGGNLIAIASRLTDDEIAAGAAPPIKPGFRWATAEDLAPAKVEASAPTKTKTAKAGE